MAMEWQDTHDFAKHPKRATTLAGYLMWQLFVIDNDAVQIFDANT
jgi:hypothetical protein